MRSTRSSGLTVRCRPGSGRPRPEQRGGDLMNPTSTRMVTLLRRPELGGEPRPEDFSVEDRPIPALASGELLVRNVAMSVDPSMRGRLDVGEKHYTTNFEIGEPLDGSAIGVVLDAETDAIPV